MFNVDMKKDNGYTMFLHNKGSILRSTIGKWGNSAAVRIPASVLAQANLNLRQPVKITVSDGAIVIQGQQDQYDLQTLLADITEDNTHTETDFGAPVGKELL